MYKIISITALSLFFSGMALAQDMPVEDIKLDYSQYYADTNITPGEYLQLSEAKSAKSGNFTKMPKGIEEEQVFEEDWLTANKIHKYLGIGSLGFALLAAIVPKPTKEDTDKGNHKDFAEAAAALGGAAVATGVMFHYDDIFDYGASDPDNLHATYATLGAIGYALAVSDAPEAQHVGYGMLGAILMTVGIKYTW